MSHIFSRFAPCPCEVVQIEMLPFTMSMSVYKYECRNLYSPRETETIVMRDVSAARRGRTYFLQWVLYKLCVHQMCHNIFLPELSPFKEVTSVSSCRCIFMICSLGIPRDDLSGIRKYMYM